MLTDDRSSNDWIIGICFTIMGTLCDCVSKLAIRKSWLMEHDAVRRSGAESAQHEEEEEEIISTETEGGSSWSAEETLLPAGSDCNEEAECYSLAAVMSLPPALRRRILKAYTLRVSGILGMSVLDPVFSILGFSYASPSLLAPVAAMTPVWVVLFSHPLIGEKPTVRQLLAASVIVLGATIVGIFGDHTNEEGITTVQDVIQSYRYPPFLAYLGGLVLWMGLLGFWILRNNNNNEPLSSTALVRFSWGVAGGSVTGLQNFIKDAITVIKVVQNNNDNDDDNHGANFPWLLLLILIPMAGVAAFGGLLLLTACMKRYDAAYSSGMFVASYIISCSIMSAVHYATFADLNNTEHRILYPCGLLVLMSGIYMLLREQQRIEQYGRESDGSLLVCPLWNRNREPFPESDASSNEEQNSQPFLHSYTRIPDSDELDANTTDGNSQQARE